MATQLDDSTQPRLPLSRQRVLGAAVALADAGGVEALSMRRLAQELGVVPMALYKHVANKDEMLDGMVDVVVGEIDPPLADAEWKTAIRERVLYAPRAGGGSSRPAGRCSATPGRRRSSSPAPSRRLRSSATWIR